MTLARRTPRLGALALAGAALALTACSSEDDPTVEASSAPPPASAPAPAGTTPAAAPPAASGNVLIATVGTPDSPEAFEIALTTSDGKDVTTLTAGTYTIKVTDNSRIHNFALSGEGVSMSTGIEEKESPTWTVDLKAGSYTFICTPHPGSMSGGFTVT